MTFFKHDGTYCYVANPENKKKVIQQGDNWFDESLNKVIDKYVPWPCPGPRSQFLLVSISLCMS